ncbi:MAG TPA: hypothetical protein VFS35_09065 [Terrimicrobiaceae bacterium]|nr:hypothetical protein [Terrimicrobiaceae bacterium]
MHGRPVPLLKDPLMGALGLEVAPARANGVAAEVGSQRVGGRGVVGDRFALKVQKFTPLAALLVGHPHARAWPAR